MHRSIISREGSKKPNTLYIFGEGWERFSQLTKAEIISGSLHRERIVHSAGWKARLHRVLGHAAAAE